MSRVESLSNIQDAIKVDCLSIINFNNSSCKQINSAFEDLSGDDKYKNVTFFEVEVENGDEIAQVFNLPSVPTLQANKKSMRLGEMVPDDEAYVAAFLDKFSEHYI